MKTLTADTARALLARMKENATHSEPTIHEGYTMQALEIALPVLERIETVESGLEDALGLHRLRTAEEGHSQLSDGFRAGARWAARYTTLPQPQPSITPQIDNDDWIEWKGGACPVIPGSRVDLRLRGGLITNDYPAECAQWSHHNEGYTDIIAYRVIENDGREG